MMRKLFAISVVAATLLMTHVSADTTTDAAYTAPTTPLVSLTLTGGATGNVGGVKFEANGETPTFVSVSDASGLAVAFTVCQDQDAAGPANNGTCDADEPSVSGCGTADLTTSAVAFDAVHPVDVFVTVTGDPTASPFCAGPATTGVVSLTTA